MRVRAALSILYFSFLAVGAQPSRSAREICHGATCYPAVFVPTEEFQIVHDDQSIPAGLRVRINMETGRKEARLLSPGELDEHDDRNDLALVPGETVHEAPKAEDTASELKPFPPTKALHGADRSEFGNALEVLRGKESCSEETEEALDVLEDLVHELEFGLRLVEVNDGEIPERLLRFMESSSSPRCRAKAALVLGSALQNNENAMRAMPHDIALQTRLLHFIEMEDEDSVRRMLVYTLSASMAQSRAKSDFVASDGHRVLMKAYHSGTNEMQAKIGSFIEDHFAQLPAEEHDKVTLQRGSGYEAKLNNIEALERWFNQFQTSLLGSLSSVTVREKLLSAVSQIKRAQMDACTATPAFLEYLARQSLDQADESTEALTAMARSARSLFGNPKASRKHAAAYI